MTKSSAAYVPAPAAVSDRFPRIVILIIIAEFCERFSYSGMRAFLTLYLRSKLGYSDDGATEIYHIFSTLVYVFPILGGIIADNGLGKFRTILYMMFVYAAGNILVAVTSIPHLGLPARAGTLLGLFMITVGTGGIKPCVSAFGGDQFHLPEQERHLSAYFSILYFVLCVGSLIAKTVTPIFRSEIRCFGDKDCYPMAFGAPSLVVALAIVIFSSARRWYIMKEPSGSVVADVFKCINLGIRNKFKKSKVDSSGSWLDSTKSEFGEEFVEDVKKTLQILVLFTTLPMFFALLDQQGSRWTLQATKMDGRFGLLTIKPDQMQVVVPVFILVLIPLFQKVIYPFLERFDILRNPFHRLTLGGILAAVSFIASGMVQLHLQAHYPELPRAGFSQVRVFNGHECSVSFESAAYNLTYTIPPLAHFKKELPVTLSSSAEAGTMLADVAGDCLQPLRLNLTLEENKSVSFFLSKKGVERYIDNVEKTKTGFPFVRMLVSDVPANASVVLYHEDMQVVEMSAGAGTSRQQEVFVGTYSVQLAGAALPPRTLLNGTNLGSGGVYTILVNRNEANVVTVTEPNSITMAWLLPQMFIMAVGEVLYAVTGSEFAFREAPETMKAVMYALWLLTDACGNIIIIICTRLFANYDQASQFFGYTAMMLGSTLAFNVVARRYPLPAAYTSRPPSPPTPPTPRKRAHSTVSELAFIPTE